MESNRTIRRKRLAQDFLQHIYLTANRLGIVEIHCGILSPPQLEKLGEYFIVEKRLFGYYKFTKKESI